MEPIDTQDVILILALLYCFSRIPCNILLCNKL